MNQKELCNKMINELTDGLKKVVLVGIGAMATTAEKSKELVEELVKKGELTVEQGKVLNEELKHSVKEKIKDSVTVKVVNEAPAAQGDDLLNKMDSMSEEELAAIREKLESLSGTPEEAPTKP